jgi:hypothetical protein
MRVVDAKSWNSTLRALRKHRTVARTDLLESRRVQIKSRFKKAPALTTPCSFTSRTWRMDDWIYCRLTLTHVDAQCVQQERWRQADVVCWTFLIFITSQPLENFCNLLSSSHVYRHRLGSGLFQKQMMRLAFEAFWGPTGSCSATSVHASEWASIGCLSPCLCVNYMYRHAQNGGRCVFIHLQVDYISMWITTRWGYTNSGTLPKRRMATHCRRIEKVTTHFS